MSADFHVDLNHEAVRQMLGGLSNGTGAPGTEVGGQENGLCSPAERKPGDCYLSLDLEHWLCFPKQVRGHYSKLGFIDLTRKGENNAFFLHYLFCI